MQHIYQAPLKDNPGHHFPIQKVICIDFQVFVKNRCKSGIYLAKRVVLNKKQALNPGRRTRQDKTIRFAYIIRKLAMSQLVFTDQTAEIYDAF